MVFDRIGQYNRKQGLSFTGPNATRSAVGARPHSLSGDGLSALTAASATENISSNNSAQQ